MDLSAADILALLDRICDEQGFCMPPPDRARIAAMTPLGAEAFAEEVLAAEGFDPQNEAERKEQLMRMFLEAEQR
jgi:hypothetical protein